MATNTETVDQIDSSELFDSAVSDEPAPQPEPVAEPQEGQPRDEQGRFAAKQPEPEPEPEPQPAPQVQAEPGKEAEHMLPSWRAREIAEERRAAIAERDAARREAENFRAEMAELRRQMQANQPRPEPVDIFADPNGFMQQQLTPLQQEVAQIRMESRLELSRLRNYQKHGEEAVQTAEAAVGDAMQSGDPEIPGLQAKMRASSDPVGVVVDWYKSRSMMKETGGDLNAFRQRVLEEAMKDPAFQAKVIEATRNGGQPKPSTTVQLPPSLSRTASAAPASGSPEDGDASDAAMWAFATR